MTQSAYGVGLASQVTESVDRAADAARTDIDHRLTETHPSESLVLPDASRAGGQTESIEVEPPSRADKLVEAIGRALHDGEIGAVEMLLRLLALEDPRRAQDVVDTMRLGIAITEAAS